MTEKIIHELMNELHSLRVSLEGLRITLAMLVRDNEDHEARVRALERQHQMFSPVFAGLLFVLGGFVTAVVGRWVG